MIDAHEEEAWPNSGVHRLAILEATNIHDSWITAVTSSPITVGKNWTQVGGLTIGPQNFDVAIGPDLRLSDSGNSIELLSSGRLNIGFTCKLENPTADGWFEGAVQPNALSLLDWPSDLAQVHDGRWIPVAAASFPDANLGFSVGYVTPTLIPGADVTCWVRYATEHGGDATPTGTIDVSGILYVVRLSS